MNSIDLVVIIVMTFFLLRGLFRGFILELTIVIGLIAGYVVAIGYHDVGSAFLKEYFSQLPDSVTHIISFSVIFVAVNIVLRLVANVITKTLKFAMLGWLNKLLGASFGVIKGVVILGIAVFLLNLIPYSDSFLQKAGKKESFFYPLLELIGPALYKQAQDVNPEHLLK